MHIEWSDKLKTGIDIVDLQHRKLFELTNSLLESIEGEVDEYKFTDAVFALKDYTVEHFTTETGIMRKCGYPRLREHEKEHSGFIARVMRFDLMQGEHFELESVRELCAFLGAWLLKHTSTSDMDFARYHRGELGEKAR